MNAKPSHLGRFTVNLILLIGLGVLVSWWFLYYTSLFPAIGGLLGLGGVLAWAAFVSGLITGERKQELQEAFENRMLLSRRMPWVLLTSALACAGVFGFFGSVEVGAIRDSVNRTVQVYAGGSDEELLREVFLPARGSTRFALRTPWLGSRTYRIKVSGLPSARVEVRAWHRRPVTVPDTFVSRPVLLLRPSAAMGNQLRAVLAESARARLTLRLYEAGDAERPAAERVFDAYTGESVWIGPDREYELSEDVLSDWRRLTVRPEVLERWRSPLVAGGVDLEPGQRVEARIELTYDEESSDGEYHRLVRETVTVRPVVRLADLPQKEVLDGR